MNTGTEAADKTITDDEYEALSAEERSRLRGDGLTPSTDTSAGNAPHGDGSKTDGAVTGDLAAPGAGQAGQHQEEEGRGGQGIPRARFNEVNERRREAEEKLSARDREIDELRAQLAAQGGQRPADPSIATASADQAINLEEAEERYSQALLDGDSKAAAGIRMEINRHIEQAAYQRMVQATSLQQSRAQTQATVEQLLQQFPWLDEPEGAEALELIEASVAMKVQRGTPYTKAVQEATQAIAPRFAPTPSRVGQDGGLSGDMRTQRANERGASHSLQQPPLPQAGMGNRATPPVVDTSKLSDEEYMALPEAERKKARGD